VSECSGGHPPDAAGGLALMEQEPSCLLEQTAASHRDAIAAPAEVTVG